MHLFFVGDHDRTRRRVDHKSLYDYLKKVMIAQTTLNALTREGCAIRARESDPRAAYYGFTPALARGYSDKWKPMVLESLSSGLALRCVVSPHVACHVYVVPVYIKCVSRYDTPPSLALCSHVCPRVCLEISRTTIMEGKYITERCINFIGYKPRQ